MFVRTAVVMMMRIMMRMMDDENDIDNDDLVRTAVLVLDHCDYNLALEHGSKLGEDWRCANRYKNTISGIIILYPVRQQDCDEARRGVLQHLQHLPHPPRPHRAPAAGRSAR